MIMGCYLDWENDIENKSHSKKKIGVCWHITADCLVKIFISCSTHPMLFAKIAFRERNCWKLRTFNLFLTEPDEIVFQTPLYFILLNHQLLIKVIWFNESARRQVQGSSDLI